MGIETGLPIAKSPRAARSPEAAVCPLLEEEVCLTSDLRVAFTGPHSGEWHSTAFHAQDARALNRDFSGTSTGIFQRPQQRVQSESRASGTCEGESRVPGTCALIFLKRMTAAP